MRPAGLQLLNFLSMIADAEVWLFLFVSLLFWNIWFCILKWLYICPMFYWGQVEDPIPKFPVD